MAEQPGLSNLFGLTHTGSWGTPELKISERLSDFFGQGRTSQGGSNMYGDQSQTKLVPSGIVNGNTQFVPSGTSGAYGIGSGYKAPASSNPTGGSPAGGGGGGGSPPNAQTTYINGKKLADMIKDGEADQWGNPINGGGVDYAAQARNEINSGYDNYFRELDNMMGELPGQADTQKGIASNSYNQGVTDINSQKESSLADLNTQSRKNTEQQVKGLRDIGENIGNLMRTGQVMLGTRGAGDSSAANMYSYALTKLGSKQRGGVLEQTRAIENDIQDRVAKLNNVVTSELGKLKTNYDNTVLGITQWLGEQQNAIRQAKANGQIQKGQSLASLSTQLLQTATAALMQAKQEVSNRRSMLEQWAMNNAKDIQGLRANLAEVSNYTAPGVTAGQINGIPTFDAQGNMSASFYPGAGYGSNKEEKKPKYLSQLSNYVG